MAEYQGVEIPEELLEGLAGGAAWSPDMEQAMKSLMMTFKTKGMSRDQAMHVWIHGGECDAQAQALIDEIFG